MVQQDVPTGREVREHLERWEALPEGERPWPLERWDEVEQGWAVAGIYNRGLRYDDDTPQPGLRLVPLPQPETERVPWWAAKGRLLPSGEAIEGVGQDTDSPDGWVQGERGSALGASTDGTVEVLVEPESPTRLDPPEGWVVCRDREILRAADERRMVRWWCGSWSDPLGGWDYDARYIDDDRFAVPADMIPEPWTPKLRDRVLVEVVVRPRLSTDADYPIETHAKVQFLDGTGRRSIGWVPTGSLRPFPEDGEA